ncbi:MAG TPA: sulfatase [Planctomycetota bacterium]
MLRRLLAPLVALASACGSSSDPTTLPLSTGLAFARLQVPATSRPHAPEPPERIALVGWKEEGEVAIAPLPVRPRSPYFLRPPPGMRVLRADGTPVYHTSMAVPREPHWSLDSTTIRLSGAGRPEDGALHLEYGLAYERERALNQGTSGLAPEAFVRTTVQAGATSWSGLLLPAPAEALFELELPPQAELTFHPLLVPPEVADAPPSDGAEIVVTLTTGEETVEVWRGRVVDASAPLVRLDLSSWGGRAVTLAIRTDPLADARFDYAFLGDPRVGARRPEPRRVVVAFVDTLRADHLGVYGHERPTSPALDALAADSVRFTQARSVAPWTLPSVRSLLTGRLPEDWSEATTLASLLRAAGFATAMFAANGYASASFEINRGWGRHEFHLEPRADEQVDRALAWLAEQDGQDALVLLHLMDVHMPFQEPERYRRLFAGDLPATLPRENFSDREVREAALSPADQAYVRDRYDNNVRFVDDQLARLWAALGPQDVLLFLSDHGEEFWDHGAYGHGHALWDELLRVPLVLRASGLPSGKVVDAPVSLLDVLPTVLDLLGLPVPVELEGSSLVPLARGDAAAERAFRARDQLFGYPWHGSESWGVLHGFEKYVLASDHQMLFDLGADPGELADLFPARADAAPEMRGWLADALGRAVLPALRFTPHIQRGDREELVLDVRVPGGLRAAWVGDDPTETSAAELVWEDGADTARISWPPRRRMPRTVWLVPTEPLASALPRLEIEARSGSASARVRVPPGAPTVPDGRGSEVLSVTTGKRRWSLALGYTPLPHGGTRLTGDDPELRDSLSAIGYATGEQDEDE